MARCIQNEKEGRKVFYGAMVVEGVVALIWAAIGMSFFGGVEKLNGVMVAHEEMQRGPSTKYPIRYLANSEEYWLFWV